MTTVTACSCSQRRSFLKTAVAAGIGSAAVSVPVVAGVKMTLAPLILQPQNVAKKKYAIATVETLTATPQKFDIVDDLRDAWMTSPQQIIGSVLVAKDGDNILAFSTVCPHAGCTVLAGEQQFYCPCHSAHFALDGSRLDQVSPRNLDSLETSVENGTLYVTFARFVCGVAEKKETI